MILNQQSDKLSDYLHETEYVDFSNPAIQSTAARIFEGLTDGVEIIRAGYEYVRDEIHHSNDIGGTLITKKASDVLQHKQGMCYAKTILLAAFLRMQGIPTGFCYQSLAEAERADCKHNIHALNAVYISSEKQWVRIDPRGNTARRNAQFYPDNPLKEQLVYAVREAYGEKEYPTVYAQHPACVMKPLLTCSDCQEMMKYHLPDVLVDG